VAGFDETGFRVEGKLAWVHCARTGKYTLLMVHPRHGKAAMEAMGVLPSFSGVAVHDAWAPYDLYTGAAHQLCCAHYPDTVVMPIRVGPVLAGGGARSCGIGIIERAAA
jgi:transposase